MSSPASPRLVSPGSFFPRVSTCIEAATIIVELINVALHCDSVTSQVRWLDWPLPYSGCFCPFATTSRDWPGSLPTSAMFPDCSLQFTSHAIASDRCHCSDIRNLPLRAPSGLLCVRLAGEFSRSVYHGRRSPRALAFLPRCVSCWRLLVLITLVAPFSRL